MSALRDLGWRVGAPVRLVLLAVVRTYRVTLGGLTGGQCRFYPTCSMYAEEAIRGHGAIRGTLMSTWRVLRCGPFTAGGVDPVPRPRRHGLYDEVTQGAMP